MPKHFHWLFSVLKIEIKTKFCFLNYHLMSLNAKKILEHIFWKFYMWNISIWKKFPVFRPLFRRRLQGQGIIFFLLFSSHFDRLLLQLQTLQVSEGVLVQKYFLNRPWSQKNLMSSWGGRWCRCSPSASSTCLLSLARAYLWYHVFTFHSILTSTH